MSATYDAIPASAGVMRSEVCAIGHECGMTCRQLGDLRLAVSEAATNAILHGPHGPQARISVEVSLDDDELLVKVGDGGDGMRSRTDSPGAGLGLSIIGTIAARLEIIRGKHGTEVWMGFPCRSPRPGSTHLSVVPVPLR